jgi:SAM-dependent methyltransferase
MPPGDGHSAYVLPRHPLEIDRLDIQHYAVRDAVGANYLAPIERPVYVLDIGCGPGQWAYDLCGEFPEALVVGLDLVPSKPSRPPNFRFVRANALQGLPLRPDWFDFVHQRFMIAGIPVRSFALLVAELARVTRPGGWIELVESHSDRWLSPTGPATRRLQELSGRLGTAVGIDTTGIVHDSLGRYLEEAGIVDVHSHAVTVPVGVWGGPLGELAATDFRAVFARLGELLVSRLGVPSEDVSDLRSMAHEEFERLHTSWAFTLVWGRKPG